MATSPAIPDFDDGVPTSDDVVEPLDADIAHAGGIGDLDLSKYEEA